MEKNYLIIDLGSSSKRYGFYSNGKEIFRAHFEKSGDTNFGSVFKNGSAIDLKMHDANFMASSRYVNDYLNNEGLKPTALGVRIVAPGTYFTKHQRLTQIYLTELESMRELAPLHSGATIDEVLAWQGLMPHAPLYALSDSAFHISQPPVNRHYNIPLSDTIDFDLFRFGYHGISCASTLHKLTAQGALPPRIIICHLGSGCSVVAIKEGNSARTSMGFTPLEGVCMSTRVGTIDAGALLYLQNKKGVTSDELYTYLNTECGLKGLSGTSGDMREVLTEKQKGNTRAELALEIFVRRIQEAIAASIVTLQGVDLIVFTATISEKSPLIRELICTGLQPFGVMHDSIRNNGLVDKDGEFNRSSSKVKLAVIKTDELAQMVRELDVLVE